jgi:16S rRNA processing protein RimM
MTAAPHDKPAHLIVGRVRRAHGVRGDVLVEVMTESPDRVFANDARLLLGDHRGAVDASDEARTLRVEASGPFAQGLRVRFVDVATRTLAEQLGGRFLLVPADEIDPPAIDEIFEHDLIGLRVIDRGTDVGSVTGFFETPAGLLLEVRRAKGIALLPYRLEFIKAVDLDRGTLEIDVPDGLLTQEP